MPRSNILVVVVDGLRASALGAYGNTSFPTPALDQFAAESLLLDACYAPAVELGAVYRALWQSSHPARTATCNGLPDGADRVSVLPILFAERGYQTTLITDEPQLASFVGIEQFHEYVQLASPADTSTTRVRADDISKTDVAHLFAAASNAVGAHPAPARSAADRALQPKLVWVHARGMYGPWDAPLELQHSLLDEGDPPPVETVAPPNFVAAPEGDPDAAFRYGCAYAAQVIALDACWQGLLDRVDSDASDNPWLVMLLGARGFPLGEHFRIGGVDSRLYTEQLHVPWLIRFPDGRGRLARSSALATHLDVLPTLLDWIDGGNQGANDAIDGWSLLPLAASSLPVWLDALLSTGEGNACSYRTAAWCLRDYVVRAEETPVDASAASTAELFVRPDDRWEANDVFKLCPDVVDELRAATIRTLATFSTGEPTPRNILPAAGHATGS